MTTGAHGGEGHGGAAFVVHERVACLQAHPETSHTEHGLTFVTEGWIRMESGGEVRAEAGAMIVVPAGIPHRDLGGGDLDYWLVSFCASCLALDEGQPLMESFRRVRHGAVPVVAIPKSRRRRVVRLFRELDDECRRDAPESFELSRSLLLLLLGELLRAMPGEDAFGAQSARGSLVGDALGFIQRRAFDSISLAEVAAAVHRTPAHVAATVKKATGYSVGAWIRAARVAEAASRLTHTDDSLDEIAARVGWGDTTHFIRQFRKVYGQTPAAWRRARRGAESEAG